jgi:hypothetical protein
MKKALIGVLVFIAFVSASFALRHKTDVIVSPDTNVNAPATNEPTTLPTSFKMNVQGDFSDYTIKPKYEGGEASSAFIMSSGGEELEGEVQYTYAVPGTDGYLIVCEIKNKKWVANTSTYKECTTLVKLATTRTELIKQITSGELKPVQSDWCVQKNRLCYELK